MDVDCLKVSLAPHWAGPDDRRHIFLVRAVDWLQLTRDDDYEASLASETVSQVDHALRSRSRELIDFLSRLGLFAPEARPIPQDDLVARAAAAIERGDLVGIRRVRRHVDDGSASAYERRLVREIERTTGGRLNHEGRSYKLVPGVDESGLADRNRYEVVGRDTAVRVLKGIGEEASKNPQMALLLERATSLLSADWRPPLAAKGLVLLRRLAPRAVASQPDAAITPSQMRAMAGEASLAIHVVDLKGKPQKGMAFRIEKPDGAVDDGRLDEHGRAKSTSSRPGMFTVAFPELDGADWTGDGVLDLPENERTQASLHQVEQGDRLATIAGTHGFARWQTIWDFAGNAALKELRGTAHVLKPGDQVSIPTKLERTAEVPGGSAEYVVKSAAEHLRVRFAGLSSTGDDPIAFKATPDTGEPALGRLGEDGWLEVELPPHTSKVTVELFSSEEAEADDGGVATAFATFELGVGALDPLQEVSGIQARLFNLGFYDGDITGELDEDTREAIAHFRWAKLGDSKQEVDDDFLQALRDAYGV